MKLLFPVLVALFISTMAVAAPVVPAKPCSQCKARHYPPSTTPAATSAAENGVWNQLLTGFELSAGWRWETEAGATDCEFSPAAAAVEVKDPFYIGASLRLPFTTNVGAFGAFDRDWTEAPNWQTRAGLYFTPFHR